METSWAAPFDPDRLELLAPAVTVVDSSDGPVQHFTLSDTGMLVYVAGDFSESARSLVWVSRETGEAQPLAAPRVATAMHTSRRMRSGSLLDGQGVVGTFEISSGVFEPLVTGSWAIWTPDGRRVTYASNQEGTAWDIFERPVDGSGTQEALVV